MIQFLADNIDQLDLALDQLAVRDRNFDRFALMLIDNVVELTLLKFLQDKANDDLLTINLSEINQKIRRPKIPWDFPGKADEACKKGLIDSDTCGSIKTLHSFRNSAYHEGLRHESILHSLALFYFQNACTILSAYRPKAWGWSNSGKLSYRAMKYLGAPGIVGNYQKLFHSAYSRLNAIAASMSENLVGDLSADFSATVESIDGAINFLVIEEPNKKKTRNDVVIEAQLKPFIHTIEAAEFAETKDLKVAPFSEFWDNLFNNYDWPIKSDPIPDWWKSHKALAEEKNAHKALNLYCDFMRETEKIGAQINESAAQVDWFNKMQIDSMLDE